jgi:carbonic anhydrase
MTFPCVRILVERGKLQLHGAYFGVATGVLLVRDPETGEFRPAVETMPERVSMFSARDAVPPSPFDQPPLPSQAES